MDPVMYNRKELHARVRATPDEPYIAKDGSAFAVLIEDRVRVIMIPRDKNVFRMTEDEFKLFVMETLMDKEEVP